MRMDEADRVLESRVSGSPPATLRTMAGTLSRRVSSGTLSYLGTMGKIGDIGTVGLVKRIGTMSRIGTVGVANRVGTVGVTNRTGTIGVMNRLGTLRYVGRLGTQPYIGRLGTQPYIGRIGTLPYIGRAGTIGRIGTVKYLGSVSRVAGGRVGSLGYLGSVKYVGTVNRLGGGRLGTIGYLGTVNRISGAGTLRHILSRREEYYTTERDNVRLGPGSIWIGSWRYVGSYETKSFLFSVGNRGTSGGGSVALVAGMVGTGVSGGTGTYYGPARLGKGTYSPLSYTEVMRYVRPWVRQHGGAGGSWVSESGGTVSFHYGLRA